MSYHQSHEFLAIERSLAADELAKVRQISSRAVVSPRRFSVSYDYGDLRGDPVDMLVRWYDLYLYRSSNYARLAIKVPARLFGAEILENFEVEESQEFSIHGTQLVVFWQTEQETTWVEDETVAGEAAVLTGVRAALLRGDLWPLYLGWLATAPTEDDEPDDEVTALPVPAGLDADDPICQALAEFLGIDSDLLAAAAEFSTSAASAEDQSTNASWLAQQPSDQKDQALLAVLLGTESNVLVDLQVAFAQARREAATKAAIQTPTAAQLAQHAAELRAKRERAAAERKARERAAHLAGVTKNAAKLWQQVFAMRDDRTQSGQTLVVQTLVDLRDAANTAGLRAEFDQKLTTLVASLSPTRALYKRLDAERLVPRR